MTMQAKTSLDNFAHTNYKVEVQADESGTQEMVDYIMADIITQIQSHSPISPALMSDP